MKLGGCAVNRARLLGVDRAAVVDRVTDDVQDAPQALGPDGHRDGGAGVAHFHAADEAVGGVHRDGADGVLAEVQRDLEGQVVLGGRDAGVRHLEGVQDLRELAPLELDVHDGPDDLDDLALPGRRCGRRERGGHGRLGLLGAARLVDERQRASTMVGRGSSIDVIGASGAKAKPTP